MGRRVHQVSRRSFLSALGSLCGLARVHRLPAAGALSGQTVALGYAATFVLACGGSGHVRPADHPVRLQLSGPGAATAGRESERLGGLMRKQRPDLPMANPPPGHSGTGKPLPPPAPPGAPQFDVATNQADALQPFLASGGYTFWPEPGGFQPAWVDPAGDGAQLVASVFVPNGKVAFCKEIRIAPLKPAVLADVWNTVG